MRDGLGLTLHRHGVLLLVDRESEFRFGGPLRGARIRRGRTTTTTLVRASTVLARGSVGAAARGRLFKQVENVGFDFPCVCVFESECGDFWLKPLPVKICDDGFNLLAQPNIAKDHELIGEVVFSHLGPLVGKELRDIILDLTGISLLDLEDLEDEYAAFLSISE